ncbi:MAG TPA: RDD family protein [Candidatus Methanofastidiosa archaeon]|nr:RDD family protein [Candidatus Methanofastidiosa archaeon]
MENIENMDIGSIAVRAVAFLIDQILIGIVVAVLLFLGVGSIIGINILSGGHMSSLSARGTISFSGLMMVLWILYFTYFEGSSGQTIGKKLMNLKVIKTDGREMDYLSALVRNVLRIVDSLPTLYILGILLILVTKERQRLGDMVAGTIVVKIG